MPAWPASLQVWLERAELLGAGLEGVRAEARAALEAGRPGEARSLALQLLERRPSARTALAIWAEAAAELGLDEERVEALDRLSDVAPERADVWLELADARSGRGQGARAELERAVRAAEPRGAADAARLRLAYADVRGGDPDRAERWLDGLGLEARRAAPAALARADLLLARGDVARASTQLEGLGEGHPLDAAGASVRARVAVARRAPDALRWVVRALLLDAPDALDAAVALVERSDAEIRAALERAVGDARRADDPRWLAALAGADGDPARGLAALAAAVRRGAAGPAIAALARAAVRARAPAELALAVTAAAATGVTLGPGTHAVAAALGASGTAERLAALDGVSLDEESWAADLRRAAYLDWLPPDAPAAWPELGAEATALARALGAPEELRAVEALELERARPLRVVVVGEFNAGKSSFVNALLGEEVAPTGVLPTTATLNHLAWAERRFARVVLSGLRPERVVPFEELRASLAALPAPRIERVMLHAPIEWLRRVEIIDTPGRNAPDPDHAAASRRAVSDAHAAVFLLDATRPLSRSEADTLCELADASLPTVVLLNKTDRLRDRADVTSALDHVREGIAGSLAGPRAGAVVAVGALSARLALRGRAGDVEALGRSGWPEVEALLEATLVGQSAVLRERALRSRARAIVARLCERGAASLAAAAGALELARARRAAARAGLDALDARGERLEGELIEALRAGMNELAPEWQPHAATLDELAGRRFVARRAEALVPRVLAQFEAGLALGGDLSPRWRDATAHVTAALVRALAPGIRRELAAPGGVGGPELRWLAATLLEQAAAGLGRLASEELPAPQLGAPRRAEALAAALSAAAVNLPAIGVVSPQ